MCSKRITSGAHTFAPFARVSYLSASMDGYDEVGSSALKLRVNSQDVDSLTGVLGFRAVSTFSTSKAIISPQFSLEYIHEFSDDSRQIVSSYVHDPRNVALVIVTDDPDRDYFSASLGVSAVFQNSVQVYGEVRSLLGLKDVSEISGTVGVRFEF